MPRRLKLVLVIFSICLNLAFLGTWATRRLAGCLKREPAAARTGPASDVWCPLFQELNLNQDQRRRMEPCMRDFRTKSGELSRQIDQSRFGLIEAIAADQPDPARIEARQEEILAAQRKIQGLTISCLLEHKSVLTPAQRKAFFSLIRRSCCGGETMLGGGCEPAASCPETTP